MRFALLAAVLVAAAPAKAELAAVRELTVACKSSSDLLRLHQSAIGKGDDPFQKATADLLVRNRCRVFRPGDKVQVVDDISLGPVFVLISPGREFMNHWALGRSLSRP